MITFNDINLKVPVHALIIPKTHVPTTQDLGAGNDSMLAAVFAAKPPFNE